MGVLVITGITPAPGIVPSPAPSSWSAQLFTTRLNTLTTENCQVIVRAIRSGALFDPTLDSVALAFMAPGTKPGDADWKTATWQTDSSIVSRPVYYAECLVGPTGTVTLVARRYSVWVKVTDNPEIPVMEAGRLTVA